MVTSPAAPDHHHFSDTESAAAKVRPHPLGTVGRGPLGTVGVAGTREGLQAACPAHRRSSALACRPIHGWEAVGTAIAADNGALVLIQVFVMCWVAV